MRSALLVSYAPGALGSGATPPVPRGKVGEAEFAMRGVRVCSAAAILLLMLVASACGGQRPSSAVAGARSTNKIATEKDFDPNQFSDPTTIDNQWFPLKPGTQFVYEGSAIDDDRSIARRVVFTVTDLTKVINGVRTLVAWDRDYNNRQLVEPELVFFAQDNHGNVWTLGQYPEEYDDGELVATPAWIAGLQGAQAGLVMRAQPSTGTSDYSQGLGPKVEYADRAKVHTIGQGTCVAFGCYQDVLVTEEWDAADPAARQLKYYAPGVGNIRVGWAGHDQEQEVLSLVNMVQLSPQALAEVDRQALKLEQHAYVVSKHLYGRTAPAQSASGTGQSP
jgi:hypothetical protein